MYSFAFRKRRRSNATFFPLLFLLLLLFTIYNIIRMSSYKAILQVRKLRWYRIIIDSMSCNQLIIGLRLELRSPGFSRVCSFELSQDSSLSFLETNGADVINHGLKKSLYYLLWYMWFYLPKTLSVIQSTNILEHLMCAQC